MTLAVTVNVEISFIEDTLSYSDLLRLVLFKAKLTNWLLTSIPLESAYGEDQHLPLSLISPPVIVSLINCINPLYPPVYEHNTECSILE